MKTIVHLVVAIILAVLPGVAPAAPTADEPTTTQPPVVADDSVRMLDHQRLGMPAPRRTLPYQRGVMQA